MSLLNCPTSTVELFQIKHAAASSSTKHRTSARGESRRNSEDEIYYLPVPASSDRRFGNPMVGPTTSDLPPLSEELTSTSKLRTSLRGSRTKRSRRAHSVGISANLDTSSTEREVTRVDDVPQDQSSLPSTSPCRVNIGCSSYL